MQKKGEALDTQGSDTDADNSRVIPEHTHDGERRIRYRSGLEMLMTIRAALDAEPEGLPHAAIFLHRS